MTYKLVKVTSNGEWHDYHAIRRSVLWEARGKYNYDDKYPDEYLATNHPLLLMWNNRPIGTTRLDDFGNGIGAVRLEAIASDIQRQGHGWELARQTENYAHRLELKTLYVNAAPEALGYYRKLGWENFTWNKDALTGIAADCVQMRKKILAERLI